MDAHGCWVDVGWALDGRWVDVGWMFGGRWVDVGWMLGGSWVDAWWTLHKKDCNDKFDLKSFNHRTPSLFKKVKF